MAFLLSVPSSICSGEHSVIGACNATGGPGVRATCTLGQEGSKRYDHPSLSQAPRQSQTALAPHRLCTPFSAMWTKRPCFMRHGTLIPPPKASRRMSRCILRILAMRHPRSWLSVEGSGRSFCLCFHQPLVLGCILAFPMGVRRPRTREGG